MFDHLPQGRWWDRGLQLVEGCTKVSPGCDNCWSLTAANMRRFNPNPKTSDRYEGTVWKNPGLPPYWTGQVNPQWLDLDKIGRARKPQVYTFWNDLFHSGVPDKFIAEVLVRIIYNPEHFYIICTKRPDRALAYLSGHERMPFRNRLMIMTTAENQEMADRRLPFLLQIPGVLHGVSVEPGLGMVDLMKIQWPGKHKVDVLSGGYWDDRFGFVNHSDFPATLDWVICGGETGPHARPLHSDIPRKLRDDCQAAGVPFFFKCWGEWVPQLSLTAEEKDDFWTYPGKQRNNWGTIDIQGNWFPMTTPWNGRQGEDSPEREFLMLRVGKKAAGRLLDGRTREEVPEV